MCCSVIAYWGKMSEKRQIGFGMSRISNIPQKKGRVFGD